MAPLEPQQYLESSGWFDATASITPEMRAKAAADSINPSREKKMVAAGFLQDNAGFQAMMNSKGLFGYYPATGVNFTITVRSEDGTGSGYATADANDVTQIDTGRTSAVAIDKAVRSMGARAIEPGKYTVILEPEAVVEMLQPLVGSFNARQTDEGRSFLSKPGGGSKLGEKFVDEKISIWSDPQDKDVPASPWIGDGRATARTMWIDKGVVANLYYSRYWADKQKKPATPFPTNMIMAGGDASVADMIKDVARGILVTRFWYIRFVDPKTLLLTGLTRDGTFFIENGAIKHAIKNFRFNESPIIMLNNIEALGRPIRVQGSMVPPMRVRDFTFTSLSDAV
jgi:predicted Zn-dependent protease